MDKLASILIITSFFYSNSFCQKIPKHIDSASLKNEIDSILAKYGLKSKGFVINVISANQKGGQTAYSITNNYYSDIKVTQQPELNEWYKQFFIRRIEQVKVDSSIMSNKIIITIGNGSNAGKFVQQLREFLKSKGYETDVATSFEPFTGIGVSSGLYFDNITKVVTIDIGNIN